MEDLRQVHDAVVVLLLIQVSKQNAQLLTRLLQRAKPTFSLKQSAVWRMLITFSLYYA